MQDVLQREETAKGNEARQHLQFILLVLYLAIPEWEAELFKFLDE
ncbi:MAG TPA: hypothetical protein VF964_07495 [Vicinamibacteria bacterium]